MAQSLLNIPINKQDPRAIGGLDVWHLSYEQNLKHTHLLKDHRDDYYILVVVIKGTGSFHCDMEELLIKPKSILLIRPYQVHSATNVSTDSQAYFISIAPFLMPDICSNIFRNLTTSQQQIKIPGNEIKSILNTCALLHTSFIEENSHKTTIVNSLFNALINRVAALCLDFKKKNTNQNKQAYLITQQFRQLISENSFLHSPVFFAEKLNITTSHLNDCVKSTTGLSVTNILQDAMLLEAKRNLYYTNNDVKKIAFILGFEDPAYFSRLFKKLTKETPLDFRRKFRE